MGGMLLVNAVCSLTTIKADQLLQCVPTRGKYQPAKLRDRVYAANVMFLLQYEG